MVNRLDQFTETNLANDFESEYYNFTSVLRETLDRFAPLKTKIVNVQRPPWMDEEFNKHRSLRRKLERKYLLTRSAEDKLLPKSKGYCVQD